MDTFIDQYLDTVSRHLKSLPASERIDIVNEIKSQLTELRGSGKSQEEILERMGSPKDMAKAYLEDSITKSTSFSWKKLCSVIAYYSLAGTAWLFVLPFTGLGGAAFMACGVLTPIAGIIKFAAFLLGMDIPQIQFAVGSFSADAVTLLPISLGIGAASFAVGWILWLLTIQIVKALGKTRRFVSVP